MASATVEQSKDGNNRVGPICPRLIAQQAKGGGCGYGRGGGYQNGTDRGGGYGSPGSPYGQNWRTNTPATAGEIGGRGRVGRGRGRGNGRRGGKENRANKAGNPPAAAEAAQPLKLRTPEAADRSTASRSPKWRDRTRVPKEPPWILNFFTAITTHRIALCVH